MDFAVDQRLGVETGKGRTRETVTDCTLPRIPQHMCNLAFRGSVSLASKRYGGAVSASAHY